MSYDATIEIKEHDMLELEITEQEIKDAIDSFKPVKAAGSDGLHMFFYQKYWNDTELSSHFLKETFNTRKMLEDMNRTHLFNAETIKQFRPIGLCNTTYKVYKNYHQHD